MSNHGKVTVLPINNYFYPSDGIISFAMTPGCTEEAQCPQSG